jgi:AcrR family transcriptional regulator
MSGLPSEGPPLPGLRERKKARTRAAIQHEALRLFRERGYEETTVDQIAEAVEISPSTFFRYFGTKEDVVLTDDYDVLLVEQYRAQPPDLGPVHALRRTVRSVLGNLSEEERADMRERTELALSVPELRAAQLDQFVQTIRQVTELIAERANRDPDDIGVRTLAGAILGVMIAAEFYWAEHPDSDLVVLLEDALARLESGLAL